MQVEMVVQRVLQDAGRELILRQGECYDLPTPVAEALVATLAATRIVPAAPPAERAVVTPPSRAVLAAPARKRRRMPEGGAS